MNETTLKLGLIGYPLGHSVSPSMQQAALDLCGFRATYRLWETPRDDLPEMVSRLRRPDYLGANVTVPHKEAVLPLVDRLSSEAQSIGAVNTIVNTKGCLEGHNTDAPGFLSALREEAQFDPKDKRVVLLGAGGAARAVSFALAGYGVAEIAILNRTVSRAEELAEELRRKASPDVRILAASIDSLSTFSQLQTCDLLVNATSIGLVEGETPLPASLIPRGALIYDLIYRPTRLLSEARERGARTLDGLSMLVYQGALAFQLWTGRPAPVEVMREAAARALWQSPGGVTDARDR